VQFVIDRGYVLLEESAAHLSTDAAVVVTWSAVDDVASPLETAAVAGVVVESLASADHQTLVVVQLLGNEPRHQQLRVDHEQYFLLRATAANTGQVYKTAGTESHIKSRKLQYLNTARQ